MSASDSTNYHISEERDLPEFINKKTLAVVLIVLVLLMVGMEIKAHQDNYLVNYPFSKDMWVKQWLRLDDLPDHQTVIIGASRAQFGLIVNEWERQLGERPLMFAWPGQSPNPVLAELAKRESFKGTVICSIAPPFTFIHEKAFWGQWMAANIKSSKTADSSLSYHLSMQAVEILRPRFPSLNDAAYSPIAYGYANFPIENREGVLLPAIFRFNATRDADLQMRFLDLVEQSEERQQSILKRQASFRPRLTFYGPANMEKLLARVKADIRKIESRGGQVILIRPPSNGTFRDFERTHYPREQYFDALCEATGCYSIHFEDHPELANYVCVDESHLSKKDAVIFTQQVIEILKNEGLVRQAE